MKIRVYLDFELDESYTPTKMIFLAGMGGNDLVEFATWQGEGPCGWIDIPLEGVGGRSGGWVTQRTAFKAKRTRRKGKEPSRGRLEDGDGDDDYWHRRRHRRRDDEIMDEIIDDMDDPYAGNVLKAMVVQMRVVENHQNGKDTHVRGFQIFAKDEGRRRMSVVHPNVVTHPGWRQKVHKSLRAQERSGKHRDGVAAVDSEGIVGLEEPEWMGEPVIR